VLFTLCIPDFRAKKSTLLAKIQLQPIHHAMKTPTLASPPRGFALVITLLLMIILTVVAVGLLSLSTISIRTSGQAQAMATARGNARLALMMALGDLQKTIGPDRAVTANSAILVDTQKFNTTGVWESWWDFDPNSSPTPDYVAQKKDRFRRWLVSTPNPTDTQERDFAITPWTGQQITLVGGGSLGTGNTGPAQAVAGLVPVTAGKSKGAYAWHVADESIKARVNLYRDPTKNSTLAEKRALLAGHRPDPSVIEKDNIKLDFLPTDTVSSNGTAEKNFDKATKVSQKITNLGQLDLVNTDGGNSTNNAEKIKPFRNDITPYSLGILTDVRHGGLKQDLSSVFEMSDRNNINLPPEFEGTQNNPKKLYQTTLGLALNNISDPFWTNLAGYYNIFRNITSPEVTPTLTAPAVSGSLTQDKVPKTYFPGPVIARVETVFSLLAREATSSWMGVFQPAEVKNFDYTVNLVFSPIITLHNPYNVAISFHSLKVTLNNVPVAFRFKLKRGGSGSDESQSFNPSEFESLNEMIEEKTYSDKSPTRPNKKFVVHIGNWANNDPYDSNVPSNNSTDGLIVMKPGQTLVCQPFINENANFLVDSHNNGEDTEFFDYKNILTPRGLKAKPLSTPALGFETNTLLPSQKCSKAVTGINRWFLFLREPSAFNVTNPAHVTDSFFVEYKMQQPKFWTGDPGASTLSPTAPALFYVEADIQSTPNSTPIKYGNLSFDYNDNATLQNFFGSREYRCPPVGYLTASEIYVPAGNPIKDQPKMRPFAVFSAYARTTNGGVYETGYREKSGPDSSLTNLLKDGILAGKPFLFHNPSRSIMTTNLGTSKPGSQSYELNFQPFSSRGDYDVYMKINDNRVPSITGNKTTTGIMSGSYLEIPSGPMQTIADFRRSNILASSYLPNFVQPIGNSLLHPLMSPEKVIETNLNIQPEAMLDQSILANHALYDRFYFSTFATRGNNTPNIEFDKFMNLLSPSATSANISPLLTQSFTPYLPAGKTVASAKAELFSGNKPSSTAYQKAAEYQMIQGPFNVNSTNVSAWKAVLASLNRSDVTTLWAKNAELTTKATTKIPVFGMSLHNGGGSSATTNSTQSDDKKTNDWNGFRELTLEELDTLANKIVDQIRLRGPFLSMSEFVNRQIGTISDLSLSGALEKAIADSGINKDFLSGAVTELKEEHFTNVALYNYKTPKATIGNPAAGAPGWVSQGDLMHILEPSATVRSDTFVIRVCGEAKDSDGNITATAYAEAVVQRLPEYVDPVDRPSLSVYDQVVPRNVTSTASIINKTFGRRMDVISFRWLSKNEI
jgi:type II secretory pathway pseudopilin PulG